jgi:hypothetical protein
MFSILKRDFSLEAEKPETQDEIYKKFNSFYVKLSKAELEEIVHQPKDMIKSCTFTGSGLNQGKTCSKFMQDGFVKVFTPSSGLYNYHKLVVTFHIASECKTAVCFESWLIHVITQ